jgi:hypothetical protein
MTDDKLAPSLVGAIVLVTKCLFCDTFGAVASFQLDTDDNPGPDPNPVRFMSILS